MIENEKKQMLSHLANTRLDTPAISYARKDSNNIEIFIYASGKTGSASIFESFKKIKKSSMHVHTTGYFLNKILKQETLYDGFSMFDYINHINDKKNILIVDVIREPVSRKISAFFQHLTRLSYVRKPNLNNEQLFAYYIDNIQELIDLFNEKYFLKNENYYSFNEYKNDELDIKKYHFDQNERRMYIKHKNKKFLILRFDDIPFWENIIKNIGYENFKLVTANETDKKQTGELYKVFKDNYTIPISLLDKIYNRDNNILKIFYTDEELENHYNKWVKKSK